MAQQALCQRGCFVVHMKAWDTERLRVINKIVKATSKPIIGGPFSFIWERMENQHGYPLYDTRLPVAHDDIMVVANEVLNEE